MQEHRLIYLLDRYLAREATPEELREFEILLQAEEKQVLTGALAEKMQHEPAAPIDNTRKWDRMLQQILSVDKPATPAKTPGRIIPVYRWAAAAVILLAIAASWLWISENKASTALADTIISTNHEPKTVTLPDGTRVWLNAGSSIAYPSTFATNNRTIHLTGEAFFDVKHTDKLPFQIISDRATTTVLGTSFDITAYPDAPTSIAVETGKVKVEANKRTAAILEKGAQLKIDLDNSMQQGNIDPQQIAAWRNGNLIYKNETLKHITADLQRNFGDSIQITDHNLQKITINISITKAMGLQQALDIITRTTDTRLSYNKGIYIIQQ